MVVDQWDAGTTGVEGYRAPVKHPTLLLVGHPCRAHG